MTERKTPPRKTTAKKATTKKATAPRRPKAVSAVADAPPLDAVDTPPKKRPRRADGHRRGATAPPTPPELVAQREKERMVVELAAAGVQDWDEIARLAGFETRSGAWKAAQRVLDRQEFAAVADYRRLIGFRYERLIRANWEAAISPAESSAKEKATPRVMRALEGLRRTFGVDVEAARLADALARIPETAEEREAELRELVTDIRQLRVVGGTDVPIEGD